MATAQELRLQPGQIVAYISAKKEEITEGGSVVNFSGIPIDTPGATITVIVGKILEIDTPQRWGDRDTRLEVLWTNDPDMKLGQATSLHSQFKNFIGEGDVRLRDEMVHAGVELRGVFDLSGHMNFKIVAVNSIKNANEENLTQPD